MALKETHAVCRECNDGPKYIAARGLCSNCYRKPEVRARYGGPPQRQGWDEPAPTPATPAAADRPVTDLDHLRVRWFGGLAA